jgi:uncharacterized membrane protein YdjX (TVP38/TMEM64 family)
MRRDGRTPGTEGGGQNENDARSAESTPRARPIRLVVLLLGLVALGVAGYALGIHTWLEATRIRGLVEDAGAWGIVLFVALWMVGTSVNVPPVAFIVVAALVWGPLLGGTISYGATLLSVSVAFALVRRVGGTSLTEIERPWVRRVLAHVGEHPIRTAALVRMTPLFLAPFVTYALALTSMRYRDFLVGSAIGVLPGIALVASSASAVLSWISD